MIPLQEKTERDKKPRVLTDILDIPQIKAMQESDTTEFNKIQAAATKFPLRVTFYYLNLIDWDDPADPIRRLVIPTGTELDGMEEYDPSNEAANTQIPGLQHKYSDTALLLIAEQCASYCRYCFRKRLFLDETTPETVKLKDGLNYIREHPEIKDVLLTGGDTLTLSTKKLEDIIRGISNIGNVNVIRLGSKIPAFNPQRILGDNELPEMLSRYISQGRAIYLMAHFDHPKELTDEAISAIKKLKQAGVEVRNQAPMTRGINDDPKTLAELFDKLYSNGITPYYIFICRPTAGNKNYAVPIEQAWEIFNEAGSKCSGLAKTARLVMSHATGKIEVAGLDSWNVFMKYHRAKDPAYYEKGMMTFARNPKATWFDDYQKQSDTT